MDLLRRWTLIVGGDDRIRGYVAETGKRIVSGVRMDDSEVEVVPAEQLRGAVEARTREIADALRLEGYVYNSYGPRAADFIERHFGGQYGASAQPRHTQGSDGPG